jgi:arylsulfatase A-like enzyme
MFLGLCLLSFCDLAIAAPPRPNVVMIVADDLRYDELGCTGHPVNQTPTLDKLAQEGVLFHRAYATSSWCTPSRVTLMTGKWHSTTAVGTGKDKRALSREQWAETLPMVLKRAGYFTGLIGKINVPGARQSEVDYYCGGDDTAMGFYPKEFAKNGRLFDGAKMHTQLEVLAEVAEDFLGIDDGFYQRSTDGMKNFLGRRDTTKPFLLYLATEVPHGTGTRTMEQRPADAPLYRDTYRDQKDKLPLVPGYVARADLKTPKLPLDLYTPDRSLVGYAYIETPEKMREQLVRNAQTITGMDRLVARLREHLHKLGQLDNTIFLFTSDQGILYGEWGYPGKCLLYENSLRIPLIIHDPRPGAAHGVQVSDKLVVIPDLAPTILDLCGIEAPKSMQGRSLVPLMHGVAQDWRGDFFAECQINAQGYPIMQGVRSQRWKYIRHWPTRYPEKPDYRTILNLGLEGPPPVLEELYDLQNDPAEQTNLATTAAHLTELETMRRRINELQREALARPLDAPLPCGTAVQWKNEQKAFYEASQIQ